jgi:hypothetical protein
MAVAMMKGEGSMSERTTMLIDQKAKLKASAG